MECSREKEIIDVATIMRHGLALNTQTKDRSDNANAIGLLEYFTTPTEEKLNSIKTRLEPNMLKNLPIIPSRTSQNFYPLFFFIPIAAPIIHFLFCCVSDNITMQE